MQFGEIILDRTKRTHYWTSFCTFSQILIPQKENFSTQIWIKQSYMIRSKKLNWSKQAACSVLCGCDKHELDKFNEVRMMKHSLLTYGQHKTFQINPSIGSARHKNIYSLLETVSLPCVQTFAVCKFSSTRQTDHLPCVDQKNTR